MKQHFLEGGRCKAGTKLGPYEILEQLGAGGMGEVYRAHDARLDRDVALKILPAGLFADEAAIRRFRNEALALAKLNHPHIAAIYDVGEDAGVDYLVMECVPGQSLAAKLKSGALPEWAVVSLGEQIAQALEEAHEHGVVHRDLKPSNIIVTPKDQVKVLDFGLAKLLRPVSDTMATESFTEMHGFAGTLPYMAPEQLAGKPADFRSDVYSLGALLYEAATAKLPFEARIPTALVAEILNKNPVPVRQRNPDISAELQNVILRCLAKDPAQRYQRASNLGAALEALGNGATVESVGSIASKSRGRTYFVGAAIIVAIAMIGIIAALRGPKKQLGDQPRELAVLPLTPTGSTGEALAFGNGLVETLTSRLSPLSKNHSLQVVPASEIQAMGVTNLQEASQQFGATLGLELNVEHSGKFVRVNYALIDAKQHRQISGGTITAPISDPFAVQDQVADNVLKSLEIELDPEERQTLMVHGTSQPAAYDYYLQGRGYLQEFQIPENVDNAITEFRHSLEQDPRYALAYAGLGEAYWKRYELKKESRFVSEAQVACEKAIELDAQVAESHNCLGMVYSGTGKYQAAVNEYDRASKLEPTDDNAIRGLASGYAALGKKGDAEKIYRLAISLRPQYWRNYNALGALYVSEGRYADATEMFSRVITLVPDSFRGYSNLGGAYILLGRYADATNVLAQSIKIRATPDAYSNLGTAFYRLRKFDEAAANYLEATKLNDRQYTLWGNLGDAYYYSGRRTESFGAYEKAVSLAKSQLQVNPRDSSVLGNLASYLSMLGDRSASLSYLSDALRIAGSTDPNLLFEAAMIYNQFGETASALEWLAKSLNAGFSPSTVSDAPALANLHDVPKFQELLRDRGKSKQL